jgi:endonuclease/exonuclease/phosphatase family metal-dependent hydrolase
VPQVKPGLTLSVTPKGKSPLASVSAGGSGTTRRIQVGQDFTAKATAVEPERDRLGEVRIIRTTRLTCSSMDDLVHDRDTTSTASAEASADSGFDEPANIAPGIDSKILERMNYARGERASRSAPMEFAVSAVCQESVPNRVEVTLRATSKNANGDVLETPELHLLYSTRLNIGTLNIAGGSLLAGDKIDNCQEEADTLHLKKLMPYLKPMDIMFMQEVAIRDWTTYFCDWALPRYDETDVSQLDLIGSQTRLNYHHFAIRNIVQEGVARRDWRGPAILSRYPLMNLDEKVIKKEYYYCNGTIFFPKPARVDSATVSAEVEINGARHLLISTHPPKGGEANDPCESHWEENIKELYGWIQDKIDAFDGPVIVAGDFNMEPDAARAKVPGLAEAANSSKAPYQTQSSTFEAELPFGGTFRYEAGCGQENSSDAIGQQIDSIFVRQARTGPLLPYQMTSKELHCGFSDHPFVLSRLG